MHSHHLPLTILVASQSIHFTTSSVSMQTQAEHQSGYNAIYILSFISPSTSHCHASCTTTCNPYLPSSKNSATEKTFPPFYLYKYRSSSFLHSFVLPSCKMQDFETTCSTATARARWSDNATTTFFPLQIDDYKSSSHTFDMQRKEKMQVLPPHTRTANQQKHTRNHPSSTS